MILPFVRIFEQFIEKEYPKFVKNDLNENIDGQQKIQDSKKRVDDGNTKKKNIIKDESDKSHKEDEQKNIDLQNSNILTGEKGQIKIQEYIKFEFDQLNQNTITLEERYKKLYQVINQLQEHSSKIEEKNQILSNNNKELQVKLDEVNKKNIQLQQQNSQIQEKVENLQQEKVQIQQLLQQKEEYLQVLVRSLRMQNNQIQFQDQLLQQQTQQMQFQAQSERQSIDHLDDTQNRLSFKDWKIQQLDQVIQLLENEKSKFQTNFSIDFNNVERQTLTVSQTLPQQQVNQDLLTTDSKNTQETKNQSTLNQSMGQNSINIIEEIYINENEVFFHKKNCSNLKKKQLLFINQQSALKANYQPCSACIK